MTSTDHRLFSRKLFWTGSIISGVIVFLLLVDAAGKLLELQPVVQGSVRLGYPASVVLILGVIELLCVIAYVIPRTAVVGAILLTGYLGGAVATHLRMSDPLFSHTLFGVYLGVVLWGGLWFRDARVRNLLPFSAL
jgi:hypothetical protein